MGNRSAVGMKASIKSEHTIYVYSHWSEFEDGVSDAYAPIMHARKRWGDAPYANRMAISAMLKDDIDSDTGYGILVNEIPWIDQEYYSVIVWEEQLVEIYETESHKKMIEFPFAKYLEHFNDGDLQSTVYWLITYGNRKMANVSFSHGTLNPVHLLQTAIKYVPAETANKILAELRKEQTEEQMMVLSELWLGRVYDELSLLAPEGYYFGPTEGDGSDIGWWKAEEV